MGYRVRHVAMRSWLVAATATTLVVIAGAGPASFATTYIHVADHPEIQMWSYPAATANGAGSVRDRGPTFAAFSGLNEQHEPVFYEGDAYDPARRGSFIAITNTAANVPAGLDPARYQIDSIKVTTTLLGSLIYAPLGYVLHYDGTLDDSAALTSVAGDSDIGRPMEMYGIGWQGDYKTVSFQSGDADPSHFNLGDVRWKTYTPSDPEYDPATPNSISPYQYYAVDTNGADAENAVYGGYSATAAGNVTAQFTPTPFAVGKLYEPNGAEAAAGKLLANGDKFIYEPSLTNGGMVSYIQSSLSHGSLGFSFSSLHQPAEHEGTVPYPDFYLDDLDVGINPNGAAPRIELQVMVLDPFPVGDYDRDRDVDADDYAAWRVEYGSAAIPAGHGADGNGDGFVGPADYVIWRQNVAASGEGAEHAAKIVPEPGVVSLLVSICALVGAGKHTRRSTVKRVGAWRSGV
jgi:hypothetical protein